GIGPTVAFYCSTSLTAITVNPALSYLGSLVEGLSPEFKYSLVAGDITGGGLTVIANAPTSAGYSILKKSFEGESISPLGILVSAAIPTIITILVFRVI